MNSIKNIMIALDLTELDDLLIRYAHFLLDTIDDIEKIFFIHNIKFDTPDDAEVILKQLDKPLGEIVADSILEKVEAVFSEKESIYEVIVEENISTPAAIAEAAKLNQVNWIIAGKKISYRGSGLMLGKLLRISDLKVSLLLLPETAYPLINNILVPTDFSRMSKRAIELGLLLSQKTNAEISCQHVVSFPSFYFPSLPKANWEPTLKNKAVSKWYKFQEGIPTKIDCEFTFNNDKSIAESIYNYTIQNNKDLIIIGSKGKTGITSFVLGRVALQLMQLDLHVPLLVVKGE
jgi:nucleotide-binding universal stress UspA family protein